MWGSETNTCREKGIRSEIDAAVASDDTAESEEEDEITPCVTYLREMWSAAQESCGPWP